MSDVADIIACCSQWELDALRQMGVPIPRNVKGKAIENLYVPQKTKWMREELARNDRCSRWRAAHPEVKARRRAIAMKRKLAA